MFLFFIFSYWSNFSDAFWLMLVFGRSDQQFNWRKGKWKGLTCGVVQQEFIISVDEKGHKHRKYMFYLYSGSKLNYCRFHSKQQNSAACLSTARYFGCVTVRMILSCFYFIRLQILSLQLLTVVCTSNASITKTQKKHRKKLN